MPPSSTKKSTGLFLFLAAALVAAVSALPYAGGWNDGSRLASVEVLADHHTWQIDNSIFVRAPGSVTSHPVPVYPPNDQLLIQRGTQDKLFINGHYYSDKSPVPALLMAGVYKMLQLATGITAAKNPALFCYWMTLIFSGGAYVISILCIDRIATGSDLPPRARLLITGGFALASVALPYARHVNNHILLLAVFCLMFLAMFEFVGQRGGQGFPWHLPAIGSLMGIGYTIDLGVGPILVLCTVGFVLWHTRSAKAAFIVLLCSFPWFLAHHIFNYKIGGTFKPANAVPDFFLWPGSPFNSQNLTGGWAHPSAGHFLVYAVDLLVGKKGFLGHNLPLYLAVPAMVLLLRNKARESTLIPYALSVILGTWLIYAATSNNYSGVCCSVRWFVPLLAPFYCILIVFVKRFPAFETDLLILTAWGALMGVLMWIRGPWMQKMVPGYWFIVAAAIVSWLGWHLSLRLSGNRK